MKPILFLDVDGVINAFPPPPPADRERAFDARGYKICYPKGCVENVRRLARAFEPVWLTTWEHAANEHFVRDFSDGPWPVVSWMPHGQKLVGAKAWMEETGNAGRPFAQVDDDHGWHVRELAIRGFDLESEFPQPRLHVAPETGVGLTDAHAELLLDFAAGLERD